MSSESPYRDPAAAEVYRRVAMPTHFAPPARDLVAMLAVVRGERVLDVGTGTGSFAGAALDLADAPGVLVGVDRSVAMLRAAAVATAFPRAACEVPGLPFPDETFDVVGANFVLPHCRDYRMALADMTGVCRPDGRVGVTAWGSKTSEASRLWRTLVNAHVDPARFQEACGSMVPWEEWFSVPGHLQRALDEAGLTATRSAKHEYAIELPAEDYLAMRKAGIEGRLVRDLGGTTAWNEFSRRVDEEFRRQFPGTIRLVRDVHLAVGTKPSGLRRTLRAASSRDARSAPPA